MQMRSSQPPESYWILKAQPNSFDCWTWVFGLFVFNRDLIVFIYLFAIFNSLQKMLIFLFHVLLN